MKKASFVLAIFFSVLLSMPLGCTAQSENIIEQKEQTFKDYTIEGGDILRIVTWKEPDLSLESVLVRADGKITIPLLDDIGAAELTPVQLAKKIEEGLKYFIENPVVTVHVVDPRSKKFYILGEVEGTGEYPLLKPITVLQAFAIAGGFTEWASKKEIILLRNENGEEKVFRVNYKDIVNGKDFSQNLKVQPNDTIIVP